MSPNRKPSFRRPEERECPADVIGIDVRQHEQLEKALGLWHLVHAREERLRRRQRAAIDQQAVSRTAGAVFNPERIAVPGGKRFDREKGVAGRAGF